MKDKINDRKIVIVNQAVNYLTIGLCNAFAERFETVELITGSIHEQGEELSDTVRVTFINKFTRKSKSQKYLRYLTASLQIYFLLITKFRKHEVFFISNPPMAYLLKVMLPHKTSMLIWDVYPDLFKVTGMKETHRLYRFWTRLNRIVFARAHRVFTIGNRMAELLSKYVSRDKILITPIWSIFQSDMSISDSENPFVKAHDLEGKFIVQYSGNIGLTHSVEVLVEIAEKMRDNSKILFQIIGKGNRLPFLRKMVKDKKLDNVQLLPFQSDEMFPFSLSAADLGVVILDESASKGSVPSKSYNLMSFGIPSLYISAEDSELNDYADKYNHAECFQTDDLNAVTDFISELSECQKLQEKYSKNALKAAENYQRPNADDIVNLYLSK